MKWPEIEDIHESKLLKWVFMKYPSEDDSKLIEFVVRRYRKDPMITGLNIPPDDADLKVINEMGLVSGDSVLTDIVGMSDRLCSIMADVLVALGDLKWANFCTSLVAFRNASEEVMRKVSDDEVDEEKRSSVYEKKLKVQGLLAAQAEAMQGYINEVFSDGSAAVLTGRRKWEQGGGWSSKGDEE